MKIKFHVIGINFDGSENHKSLLNKKLLNKVEVQKYLENTYKKPILDPNDDREEISNALEKNSSDVSFTVGEEEKNKALENVENYCEDALEDQKEYEAHSEMYFEEEMNQIDSLQENNNLEYFPFLFGILIIYRKEIHEKISKEQELMEYNLSIMMICFTIIE